MDINGPAEQFIVCSRAIYQRVINMENIELKSLVTEDGYLELFLESGELPEPGDEHVIIEMQASPINPSDMGPLLGPADMSTAEQIGTDAVSYTHLTLPTTPYV